MSACRSACHRNNLRKSRVSDVSARTSARMSVSVSASWNAGLTTPAKAAEHIDTYRLPPPLPAIELYESRSSIELNVTLSWNPTRPTRTPTPTLGMRLSFNFVNVYIMYSTRTRVHARIHNGHSREEKRACRTKVRGQVGEDRRACLYVEYNTLPIPQLHIIKSAI